MDFNTLPHSYARISRYGTNINQRIQYEKDYRLLVLAMLRTFLIWYESTYQRRCNEIRGFRMFYSMQRYFPTKFIKVDYHVCRYCEKPIKKPKQRISLVCCKSHFKTKNMPVIHRKCFIERLRRDNKCPQCFQYLSIVIPTDNDTLTKMREIDDFNEYRREISPCGKYIKYINILYFTALRL